MSDKDKITLYRYIDERLDQYKSFWDIPWAQTFHNLFIGSSIERPAMDLAATWKGTANARCLPYVLIESLEANFNALITERSPMPIRQIQNVLHGIARNTDLGLSHQQQVGLAAYLQGRTEVMKETVEKNRTQYDKEWAWKSLLTNQDFQLGLFQSEVHSYTSLYFAYEDFLRRTCEIILNRQISTMNASVVRNAFDENIFNKCWNDTKVNHARLVRTAIAHNGCKETTHLKKVTPMHGFKLQEDGGIVIRCEHVTDLYDLLKEKVLLICGHEKVKSTIKH